MKAIREMPAIADAWAKFQAFIRDYCKAFSVKEAWRVGQFGAGSQFLRQRVVFGSLPPMSVRMLSVFLGRLAEAP